MSNEKALSTDVDYTWGEPNAETVDAEYVEADTHTIPPWSDPTFADESLNAERFDRLAEEARIIGHYQDFEDLVMSGATNDELANAIRLWRSKAAKSPDTFKTYKSGVEAVSKTLEATEKAIDTSEKARKTVARAAGSAARIFAPNLPAKDRRELYFGRTKTSQLGTSVKTNPFAQAQAAMASKPSKFGKLMGNLQIADQGTSRLPNVHDISYDRLLRAQQLPRTWSVEQRMAYATIAEQPILASDVVRVLQENRLISKNKVNAALKLLASKGYIKVNRDRELELTEKIP